MRKSNSILPIIITVAVVTGVLALGWLVLTSLPTRQLARFPTFVQALVIPEPESAVLPAPEVPVDADALLSAEPTPTLAPLETPTLVAEPEPVALSADSEAPTPTLAPIPSPTPTPTPSPLPASVRIENFTHKTQQWNNCGPATLAMALTHFDLNLTQQQTASVLKPNEEDRNVTPPEMAAYVNEHTDQAALARVNGDLNLLRTLLANGFPTIIEIGLDPPGEVAYLEWYGHYLLATGYDDDKSELWVFDSLVWDTYELRGMNSAFGRAYKYDELNTYWPQFNGAYVVLYQPERAAELAALLGDDADDTLMWQRSLETARASVAEDPEDAFSWFNLGSSLVALGDFEEATAAFDTARSIGLPWRMLWYQFGPYEAYLQSERYVDVILLANTTLQDRPFFEESFYYRGLAESALGDLEAARESFEKAASFNPNFAEAAAALAELDT